jgi:hypothetical protein
MSTTITPRIRKQLTWMQRTKHVAGSLLEKFRSNRTLN